MPRVGLSLDDYVKHVKLSLGSTVVTIEIEKDIPDIVDMAFSELKNYITDAETMTLPFNTVIDLSGKDISNVIYVMRGNCRNGLGNLQDLMYVYSRQAALSSYTITDYARAMLTSQNKSTLATDMDFEYDKRNDKLYLYAQNLVPSTITLVYTRDYKDVNEIIEPFWQNILRRLSVAMTKEILGRVRGKYNLNSATYTLDADKLLAESQAELTEIRTYLNSNSDMLLPID